MPLLLTPQEPRVACSKPAPGEDIAGAQGGDADGVPMLSPSASPPEVEGGGSSTAVAAHAVSRGSSPSSSSPHLSSDSSSPAAASVSTPAACAELLDCGSSSSFVTNLLSASARPASSSAPAASSHSASAPIVSLGFGDEAKTHAAAARATERRQPCIDVERLSGLDALLERCRGFLPQLNKSRSPLAPPGQREDCAPCAAPPCPSAPLPLSGAAATPAGGRREARAADASSSVDASSASPPTEEPAANQNAEILTVEEEEGSKPHVELELHLGVFDVKGELPSEASLREQNIPVVDSGANLHAQEEAAASSAADPVRFLLEQRALEQRLKSLGMWDGEEAEDGGRVDAKGPLIEVLSSGDESSDED
ncbi:hypothetical protein BESB_034390 [Besnoitia besnoiti]|uniref:Uncharacterized protein n=1 Tax=Besnoitia besnoiti TaxID=94643 RepID=A0A2A9ML03_BESBE|nr:hypothetical protein BESB_034390 [Besnoitia besnoiti]PFH36981.1 hypothetical protein BESB_034390 [Besnoitia besnoiti]